jgi:nicotinate-nucleotide adenylyltransferase
LRELAALHPDADLYFITGADAMAALLTWQDHEELFKLAHFVGCTRPGHELTDVSLEGLPKDRITLVEIPALTISSTDCRHRVESGEPVWYLVPDGVVQYIGKHELYRKNS